MSRLNEKEKRKKRKYLNVTSCLQFPFEGKYILFSPKKMEKMYAKMAK